MELNCKKKLAFLLHCVHHVILLFILSASFLPFPALWYIQFFLIPAMILQWQLNSGDCFLTNLEHRLLGTHSDAQKNPEFSRQVLERLTGWSPTEIQMKVIIYAIVLLMWLIAAYKSFSGFSFP